jgi:proto-oncogene serine/threonine-protein kinase mos
MPCKFYLKNFFLHLFQGRGSFGVVHEAEFYSKKVALKIINFDTNHKEETLSSYQSESENIRDLKHGNLIKYYYSICDRINHKSYIVYEYGGKSNLNSILMNTSIKLTNLKRKRLSIDLANALEYIHQHNIVHMDLKPANIIVDDRFTLKLTDFGCSVKLNASPNSTNKKLISKRWTVGTWFYRAPELFHEHTHVSTACDIYSFGICMWQLLTREYPYDGENPHVIIYQIVSRNLRPQYPQCMVTSAVDESFEFVYKGIVEKCWSAEPSERFTATKIKSLLTQTVLS